ncbi:MAG: hypothetical protein IJ814_00985 [Paludibacteraceae bacterium]|nr:hypothetical protein [Paludibacteraceae bacterium]
MKPTIIVLDLGGVLMKHNMPGCIGAFEALIGREAMQRELGLGTNGEGQSDSLMARYERGEIKSTDFIDKICSMATHEIRPLDVINSWNRMHAGIPPERIAYLKELRKEGYRLYLLSNNNELHWQHTTGEYPGFSSLFEKCFLSHEMHCSKPGREIFERAAEVVMANGECQVPVIFVDDLEANRSAATRYCGWQSCADIEELQAILSAIRS